MSEKSKRDDLPATREITLSQRAMLGLLGKNLFGRVYDLPGDTDIPALIRECSVQAVTAVALSDLQAEDPRLLRTVYAAVRNSNTVFGYHTEVHRLLTEHAIPYVILKGTASAQYYPEPLLRTMGDVDFLVKPEDMERVSDLLRAEGYTMQEEYHRFHRAFTKGSIHLEAHFNFAERINPAIDRQINAYLATLIDDGMDFSARYCTCRIPSRFHQGLIQLLHMQRHMLTMGLGLRHLCDWAVFVNSFREDEFVAMFRKELEKVGLWRYAQIMSLTAHIGLGLPRQDFMGEEYETAEAILRDLLASGNFGHRDVGRGSERFFIARRADTGREKGPVGSFIHQVNSTIIDHWPRAKENAALRLFGWVYFSLRQVVLRLKGKRRALSLVDRYQKSTSRQELYDKLRLFEPEE